MGASLQSRAERLASEIAGQAKRAEDLNVLMRLMMKSALERMLNPEMDVPLGRTPLPLATDIDVSPAAAPAREPREGSLPPSPPIGQDKCSPNRRNGRSQKT